jgi:RNA polymerase sigma-70 factor (ECF subfamily)
MPSATDARFTETHWTTVLAAAAGGCQSPQAQQALARLCESYWYPLYAFIRRRGYGPHDAQDLTQGFFVHLFEHDTLQRVDREKGRFRSFLLAALQRYLANERDKAQTLKRGGAVELVSWDEAQAQAMYSAEPSDNTTPERLFERRWAGALIERVIERLRQDYAARGRAEVHAALCPWLTGEIESGVYAELAARLRTNESSAKVALHRLRRRFGELLRHEVAHTVAYAADIDEEIRHLFAAWGC